MSEGKVTDYLPLVLVTAIAVGFAAGALRQRDPLGWIALLLAAVIGFGTLLTLATVAGGLGQP